MTQVPAETRSGFRWIDTVTVIVGGFLFAGLVSAIVLISIYGTDIEDIDPAANFWIALPIQMITQLLLLTWVARNRATGQLDEDYGLRVRLADTVWILAGPLALVGLGLIGSALRAVMGLPEDNPQALLDQVAEFRTSITAVAIVIGVVILGPVVEELTFRGLTLRTALDKGLTPALATTISAAVFAAAHLVDPSLFSAAGIPTVVVLFLFGVVLAQIRLRTGSLGAAIFTHAGFNLTTVLALFFFDTGAVGLGV